MRISRGGMKIGLLINTLRQGGTSFGISGLNIEQKIHHYYAVNE